MENYHKRSRELRIEALRMAHQTVFTKHEQKVAQIRWEAEIKNKAYKLPMDNRIQETLNLAEEYFDFVDVEIEP